MRAYKVIEAMFKAATDHGNDRGQEAEVETLRFLCTLCWNSLSPKRRAEILAEWRDGPVDEFLNIPVLDSIP
jgi:hypothetical protein